jgi:hypothetical protein
LDRFKASLRLSDSEIGPLRLTAGAGVTAFATRFLEASLEVKSDYWPGSGRRRSGLDAGVRPRFDGSKLGF